MACYLASVENTELARQGVSSSNMIVQVTEDTQLVFDEVRCLGGDNAS